MDRAEVKIMNTVKGWRILFLLGPPTLLLNIVIQMTGTVLTDLIVYRTCLVSLNIDSTECSNLHTNAGSPEAADLEAKVEPYASMIVMTRSLIETLLPALISLFLGPWSDRGGRKPLLLATFTGYALTFTSLSLMCNWDTSPWYLLLPLITTSLAGGTATARLALVCYVFDTTAEKDRAIRLTLLEIFTWSGNMLGGYTGPLIYKNYSYIYVFSVAAACAGTAVAFIHFFIPETVQNSSKEPLRSLFKISIVTELVASVFKKRQNLHRSIVWLSIFTLILNTTILQVDTYTIEFLFTRTRLGWDVQKYSYLAVTDSALSIVGLCGVFLFRHISGAITDTLLAAIGTTSAVCAAVIKSLVWKDWHIYLSLSIGIFNHITIPCIQSIISNFVPSQEIGKVFSLTAFLEVLCTLAVTPLYTLLYSNYLPPVYPSPVYLLSTSLFVMLTLFIACIEAMIRKSRKSPTDISTPQEDFRSQ